VGSGVGSEAGTAVHLAYRVTAPVAEVEMEVTASPLKSSF
jgi:hypothetical protein